MVKNAAKTSVKTIIETPASLIKSGDANTAKITAINKVTEVSKEMTGKVVSSVKNVLEKKPIKVTKHEFTVDPHDKKHFIYKAPKS